MGFKAEIYNSGDVKVLDVELSSFSVQEAATPLAAVDSSGQVGTVSLGIPRPDPDTTPNHPIIVFGINYLKGKVIRIRDSRKGFTLGKIDSVQQSNSSGEIQVTALSRLGNLNVYNLQTQPFVGSLDSAFRYYASLAGETTDILIDPEVSGRTVALPGWNGELWYNLKRLAAAIQCDISLVSGIIVLRPVRKRVATRGRDVDRTLQMSGGNLAQFVEVYQYSNTPITNALVYPPGGWSEDVSIINVNSGESVQEILQLSASVSSITQPVMQTFVSRRYDSSSVFTVVGDDGLPISPDAWARNGGSLSVSINEDTTSLTVKVQAPTGLPNRDGSEIGVYSISLSSDFSTGRYSTLRIIGTGVGFDKEIIRVPTGIGSSETGTEVGVTIDNPFLSSRDEVMSAASWATKEFNGSLMKISGTVVSVNRLGDSGSLEQKPYQFVQDLYAGETYAQVQTLNAAETYLSLQEKLNAGSDSLFENQVFGNVNGARVWDKASQRWYRIRSATINDTSISFEADDDLIHADVQSFRGGQTYANLQTMFSQFTYQEADMIGLRNV